MPAYVIFLNSMFYFTLFYVFLVEYHSKEGPRFKPQAGRSLHVLLLGYLWVLWLPPTTQRHFVRLIGD